MTRLKQVFANDVECAHVWASQSQAYGRNRFGNVYFERETIFSYGGHFPMARFARPDVVLLSTQYASPTTAGHMAAVRGALRGHAATVIKVYDVTATRTAEHRANIRDMLASLQSLCEQQQRARTNDYRPNIAAAIANLAAYVAYCRVGRTKAIAAIIALADAPDAWGRVLGLSEDAIAAQTRATAAAQAKRAAAAEREARQELDRVERLRPLAVAAWRAGSNSFTNPDDGLPVSVNYYLSGLPTMLRLDSAAHAIETSRGAAVSVSQALRVWPVLKARQIPNEHIGAYQPRAFDAAGNLLINCHTIPFVELETIAAALGVN